MDCPCVILINVAAKLVATLLPLLFNPAASVVETLGYAGEKETGKELTGVGEEGLTGASSIKLQVVVVRAGRGKERDGEGDPKCKRG
uniref:Uncharacterized protein n=1 Tax=Oryza meridionalis TaxID=40149 RepID=A0A0E0DY23_9ORYZ